MNTLIAFGVLAIFFAVVFFLYGRMRRVETFQCGQPRERCACKAASNPCPCRATCPYRPACPCASPAN